MKINIKWNICRICLNGEDQDLQMTSIFSQDQNKIEIYNKIAECGGILIEKDVNLPDLICKKCLVYLNVAFKFRAVCQESDEKLQQFLVKSNIPMKKELKFDSNSDNEDIGNESNDYNLETDIDVLKSEEEIDVLKSEEAIFDYIPEESGVTKTNNKMDGVQHQVIETNNIGTSDIPIEISIDHSQQHVIENYTTESIGTYLADGSLVLEEVKVIEVAQPKIEEAKIFTNEIEYDEDYIFDPVEDSEEEEQTKDEAFDIANKSETEKKVVTMYPDEFKKKNNEKKFICDICGNTYPRKYSLQNHYKFHLGEKNYKCDFCNKAFVTDNQLIRHIRTHTGERPYACKYCDRRFSDISTKIKHERIHTNERPYKCNECGKAFNYSNVLRHHQMVHTGEKPYECVDCNRKFTKKHQYKAHLQTFAHQQMERKPLF